MDFPTLEASIRADMLKELKHQTEIIQTQFDNACSVDPISAKQNLVAHAIVLIKDMARLPAFELKLESFMMLLLVTAKQEHEKWKKEQSTEAVNKAK